MGREVRRVPKDWEHPVDFEHKDRYDRHYLKPLHEGYTDALNEWIAERELWDKDSEAPGRWNDGEARMESKRSGESADEWHGKRPDPSDYAPEWPESERTHYQMYETCSEGTPISPVMETPEELARWLADNEASASGDLTASYEGWLRVCNGGYAPSMVGTAGRLTSGVEGLKNSKA